MTELPFLARVRRSDDGLYFDPAAPESEFYESIYVTQNPGLHAEDAEAKYRAVERFLNVAAEVRPRLVLDVGSGSGTVLRQILDRVATVSGDCRVYGIGMDISAAVLRSGAPDPRIVRLRADCRDIPLATGAVDLAICMDVVEHVESPEQAVSEIARVSRHAIFKVPLERSLYTVMRGNKRRLARLRAQYGHIHHFSRRSVLQLIEQRFDLSYEAYEFIPNRSNLIDLAQRLLVQYRLVYAFVFGGFAMLGGTSRDILSLDGATPGART